MAGLNECTYFDPAMNSGFECEVVANNPEASTPIKGFRHDACDSSCPDVPVDATCSNLNAQGFSECIEQTYSVCSTNGISPEACDVSNCLVNVGATRTAGTDAVCTLGDGVSMFSRILTQDSTCEVSGLSAITVLDEDGNERRPKNDPQTLGTLTINGGGPCPGGTCPVGFSSALSMDDIEFSVKWRT